MLGVLSRLAHCVRKYKKRKRVNEHPLATNEASDGTGEEPIAIGIWVEAALKPHAGEEQRQRSYRSSEGTRDIAVVGVSVEVKRDEKLFCGGLGFF